MGPLVAAYLSRRAIALHDGDRSKVKNYFRRELAPSLERFESLFSRERCQVAGMCEQQSPL